MKTNFTVQEINSYDAIEFIQARHYSKVMPRLTKHYLGIYDGKVLAGVLTLGWGTKPFHTINKLFPTLGSKDYYEIGKMCMDDIYPRNSETQMLSKVRQWIQDNLPEKQFLYTWADGIVGKVGYVYQAFNFLYGGYIWTDIYIGPDGEKIHPRTTKALCQENAEWEGKEKVFWLTHAFAEHKGIKRVKGKQFRYVMPLTRQAIRLLQESTVKWSKEYPKEDSLKWRMRVGPKEWQDLEGMPSVNLSVVNINKKNVEAHK